MNGFTLQQPWGLAALVLVPLLALLFHYAQRKRDGLMQAYGGAHTAEAAAHRRERRRGECFTLAGVALLALALARPGANPRPRSDPEGGRDVVFVLDVSRSMSAGDVRPSRLARAKEDISRCLAVLPRDRAGLVLFAGVAAIRCPLTTDYQFLRLMLQDAGPESVARGSTYLQSALEKTTDKMLAADRKGFEDVILLTDGGDQGSHPESTLAGLNAAGARLLVVGYGDPKIGARIPEDNAGTTGFLMEQEREVWTRLEDGALRSLAGAAAQGLYVRGGTPGFDLGRTYRQWSAQAPRRYRQGQGQMEYEEYFAWLLVPALALLLHPFAGLRRAGALVLLGVTAFGSLRAAEPTRELDRLRAAVSAETDPARRAEQALRLGAALMNAGDFDEAVKAFQAAADTAPRAERLAVYRFDEALAEAARADQARDPGAKLAALDAGVLAMRRALLLRAGWPEAAQGLEVLYARRAEAEKLWQAQQDQQNQLNQQIGALAAELQRLLEEQRQLLEAGRRVAGDRLTAPAEHLATLGELHVKQAEIGRQTEAVRGKLDEVRTAIGRLHAGENAPPGLPLADTGLEEPLQHLAQARLAQDEAVKLLGPLDQLSSAIQAKGRAVNELTAALQAFATPQSGEGDESDAMDDGDMTDTTDSDNAESQSLPMKGDFLSDPVSRALPKPNFSPQEILQEEEANAQTRSKNKPARVGHGEKDW